VVGGGGGTVNKEDRRLTKVSVAVDATGAGVKPFGGRKRTTLLTGLLGVGIRGCSGEGKVERSFEIEGPFIWSLGRRGKCLLEVWRKGESSDFLISGGFCLGKNCNCDLGIRTISSILTLGSTSSSFPN